MTLQLELKKAINTIIIKMGDSFETHNNILHFIIDTLEEQGYSDLIDELGRDGTVNIIINELKLVCNDIEYQSSIESVIANGLSDYFTTPKTTIAEAAKLYAENYNITGNFDVVINHIVTEMVEPILMEHKSMTIREAILLIGRNFVPIANV
jgi:hypothetical protein